MHGGLIKLTEDQTPTIYRQPPPGKLQNRIIPLYYFTRAKMQAFKRRHWCMYHHPARIQGN